jgi:hypothetical protein
MLYFSVIVLLAGCGNNEPVEGPEQNPEQNLEQNSDQSEIVADTVDQGHSDWVKTSLTVADLEHIEESLPPLSYVYETYDMNTQSIVNSGNYKVAE